MLVIIASLECVPWLIRGVWYGLLSTIRYKGLRVGERRNRSVNGVAMEQVEEMVENCIA